MLEIKDLHARVDDKEILKGVNLKVNAGEIHAIMGPNGSGKSTLAKAIVGHPAFTVTSGDILYNGESVLDKSPEERAHLGVFLGFQYPVEIPGVNNASFLRLAYNAQRAAKGEDELDPMEFEDLLREKMKMLDMNPDFLNRSVNEGFSGGEKKKNEILQLAVLQPRLSILDEIDSGLDIDALRDVANGVNKLAGKDNSFIIVTHYQRLLNYIKPHYVHIISDGRIVKSGGKELALELEEKGYDELLGQQVAEV